MRRPALEALIVIIACSDGEEEGQSRFERSTIVDEGIVCVRSAPSGVPPVRVIANVCRSSSCTRVVTARCALDSAGGELTLHSSFVLDDQRDGAPCTTDCMRISADCTTSALAPGDYTLRFGAASAVIRVPNEGQVPFGSGLLPEEWCD